MIDSEDIYRVGSEFAKLFGRFEFALKRSGFLLNKDVAQADWPSFARSLGEDFFRSVVEARTAETLIGEPPRKLMAVDTLTWLPEHPAPITNVEQLFVQGVCRVRNSYIHGEKFVGGPDAAQWERDCALVREAFAVLRRAEAGNAAVKAILAR